MKPLKPISLENDFIFYGHSLMFSILIPSPLPLQREGAGRLQRTMAHMRMRNTSICTERCGCVVCAQGAFPGGDPDHGAMSYIAPLLDSWGGVRSCTKAVEGLLT